MRRAAIAGILMVVVAAAAASGAAVAVPRPQLTALAYGHFRPPGAPRRYWALRVTAREPRGLIVGVSYQELPGGIGGVADGSCDVGHRRPGRVEVDYVPISGRLAAGVHRIRVTADGSLCTRHLGVRSTSRTFTVRVSARSRRG